MVCSPSAVVEGVRVEVMNLQGVEWRDLYLGLPAGRARAPDSRQFGGDPHQDQLCGGQWIFSFPHSEAVLSTISEDILEIESNFFSTAEHIEEILASLTSDLYLIIHNIDGPMLRNSKAQSAISQGPPPLQY